MESERTAGLSASLRTDLWAEMLQKTNSFKPQTHFSLHEHYLIMK